jgi:hypothetical protein
MKHLIWDMSLNPLIILKGVPATLLEPVDPEPVKALRHNLDPDQKAIFRFKVGRFDPAKRAILLSSITESTATCPNRQLSQAIRGASPQG